MRYGCAGLLAILLAGPAFPEVATLVSGLDTREQVDRFACRVRYSMAEPVASPRTQGSGAMRIRFFGHPSLEGPPQVAVNTRRRGLRYSNWQPYDRLLLDIHNPEDRGLRVAIFCKSGQTEHAIPCDLPPGAWTTFSLPIADLIEAGLDAGAITALGLRADTGKRERPSRIILDNVRLVGADLAAIRKARADEDALASRRPPLPRRRTDVAEGVVRVETGQGRVLRRVSAPVVARPEVLVVGGGLAGVAAAVTAARMGADVLLVERAGSLGGMATTGLVPPAVRRGLTRGIVEEFCTRIEKVGGREQMWNPEIMKYVLLRMMRESGARLMLYTLAVDAVVRDDVIRGVIVENKSGAQAILARIVIDCTGDGDIAARANAPFEIGRGRDAETQTQTLVFLLGNVDTTRLLPARQDLADLVKQARENGDWVAPYAGSAAIQPVVMGEHGVVNVNSINIPQVDGLKVEDLTYAHIEGQREALQLVEFYRQYVPGCEGCYLLNTAEFIGVRETRRIVGEYVLTGEDVLAGAEFRDGIARGFYPIDIHAADGTGDAAGIRLARHYEIPYRCLVPQRIDNLLVAGRCISADHVAHGSLRVMGTTMPLGEAAGCAAALCISKDLTPRELRGHKVRRALRSIAAWPSLGMQVPDNLALARHGTIATADSILAKTGYAPECAIDGRSTDDQRSRWLSGDGPPPHWLQLEFAQPKAFSRVKLRFYSQPQSGAVTRYIPRGFDIQVRVGTEWRTVASARDNSDVNPTVRFAPATAQVMRILFTVACPSDDIVRLREVEVY